MTSRPTTLGELERQSYRSRWKDGTLDLTGGLGVLGVGGTWSLDISWGIGFLVPILITLWFILRSKLVEPRIGRVRFRRERRESERSGTQGSLLLGAGVLLALLAFQVFQIRSGGGFQAWARAWIAGLPCALLALMALTAAALTGLGRFLIYAAVLLLTATVATPLGMEPGPQILIAGGLITVAGLFRFARFISEHPVPAAAGEDR
jgi:MFS family permease